MVLVMTKKMQTNTIVASPELETESHIEVRPLYTPADLEGWDYDRDVGYPGEYPFTRGVQATMYRGRRQFGLETV